MREGIPGIGAQFYWAPPCGEHSTLARGLPYAQALRRIFSLAHLFQHGVYVFASQTADAPDPPPPCFLDPHHALNANRIVPANNKKPEAHGTSGLDF